VVAIGTAYRDWLARSGVPPDRIHVVPDATDLDRFRPGRSSVLRDENAIGDDEVLIGIVGRIEPFKQQVQFLRAAARVVGAGCRAHFAVLGGRNRNRPLYYHRVRSWPARHGMAPYVTFAGARQDIEHLIPSLDVLVTLSGGSVMLEAMACGVPVISASSRDPATLRMVRDGESGRVVPARDLEALVRAMIQLCGDVVARKRFGTNGRRRVEEMFGRDRLVQATQGVYERVVLGDS
jgi:glycosyltransferase involved in cell wall biosynthesis